MNRNENKSFTNRLIHQLDLSLNFLSGHLHIHTLLKPQIKDDLAEGHYRLAFIGIKSYFSAPAPKS